MDSDDDGFAKQGGEALDIGGDFDDSEEENDDDSGSEQEVPIPAQNKPMQGSAQKAAGNPEVKGQKIDN